MADSEGAVEELVFVRLEEGAGVTTAGFCAIG